MKTCIIIEDQPPAQRILQKYIGDYGVLTLKGTFSNAIDAITFLQQESVDLIFLDIHLPKISGMDFLKTMQQSPQVILTTAFSEYALESYEYNVVDYLLKPFSFQRFIQAVTKCFSKLGTVTETQNSIEKKQPETFFIKQGYDYIKVKETAILYIKSDADYCEIVTKDKKYLSSDTLKKWLQKLGEDFCQVHKSYILNFSQVEKVSGNKAFLSNGEDVPIGRAYKESFSSRYLNE
ncbi:LytR/AlgR family response regulator transcription factor [Tenacibaculum amylolyticum]|uniref:LytR/AlgR family response regulator transcription factor n=1 Tax=Tenacibaculum amylolyticum TaxID=104269 RepID=UPI003895C7B5